MAVNIGPRIGVEGEKEYRKQVNNLITQAKTYSAEMRELESSFDDETSAMEKNRKKGELLNKQISKQEQIVEELEKGLEASSEKYGENANETLKWKQQVANAKTELNKMRSELSKLPKSLSEVSKSMQKVGKKMQDVGGKMTKYVTAPITALGAASVAAFNEVDSGMDIVVKKTGATGEALKDLQDSAKNIATTIPTSFEAAGSAVGEVNTKFGLVGEDLEALSSKFIKFADLNDTDVSTAVDKTQKVMQAFGMETEDAGKLLDVLNATGQATGISIDTLASSMTKNASSLQQMGMSAYDAAQFLGQVEMSGANTETVMTGMQKALLYAAENGKTLPEVLSDFQEKMASSASEQDKLTYAIEVFGKKAGPAIFEACSKGSLDLEAFATNVDQFLGNVETTFDNTLDAPDRMAVAMNKVKEAGANIGETVLEALAPIAEDVGNFAKAVGDAYSGLDEDQQKYVTAAVLAFGAAGPGVSAKGKTISTIGTIAGRIGGVAGKIGAATGATEALGTAAGSLAATGGPIAVLLGTVAAAGYVVYSLTKDVEASSQDVRDLIEAQDKNLVALSDSMESMNTAISSGNEAIQEVNDQSAMALSMVDELEKLQNQSTRTAAEEDKMRSIVAQLNHMYPGLKVSINQSTGAISKSTKEIRNYVKNARDMALIEAYTRASTEALDALVKANNDLFRAQQGNNALKEQRKQAQETRDALIELQSSTGSTEYLGQIQDLTNDINALDVQIAESDTTLTEYQKVVDENTEIVNSWGEQIDEVSASIDTESEAVKDNTKTTEENTEAAQANKKTLIERAREVAAQTASAITAMQKEQQEWSDLRQSTEDSIKGQIKLFDEWKTDSELTFEKMLSNIQGQKEGIADYTKNLQKLAREAEKSGDENFKAFVQYIADMGIEGAQYADLLVQKMGSNRDEFNKIVGEFGATNKAEHNLAQTLTYIKSDFVTGTAAGAKEFNAAIDKMGEDSVMGRLRKSTQETFHEVAQTMFGLSDDATKAGSEAAKNLETEVNSAKLEPEIKQVEVSDNVLKVTTNTIENNVKPTIKVGSISIWDALQNARTAMQNYFNNNPIFAKLRSGSVAHNANGGIVQNETLSWLAEGNQPEAVIPLSAGKRTRALNLYEQTGEILGVDSIPTKSSYISIPMTPASGANGGGGDYGLDAEKLYAAVAEGAAAGMENANVRIYWNDREAGRIMRDMGVQFA